MAEVCGWAGLASFCQWVRAETLQAYPRGHWLRAPGFGLTTARRSDNLIRPPGGA
jgi:hypothetical protein